MARLKANRERTAKAFKAMKPFGISAETVKSALNSLLEAYKNNWTYIEEDDYKVLIDAIFTTEEEEVEPLQKKARLESQTEFTSPSGTSVPSSINISDVAVIHPGCDDDSVLKRKKPVDLEDENLDGKENENEIEIDIASSCNGKVKLSFCICKPPEGFCIPSVDAVLKQVEDMYQDRIVGLGSEFSLSGLLKDICESLVDEGNV